MQLTVRDHEYKETAGVVLRADSEASSKLAGSGHCPPTDLDDARWLQQNMELPWERWPVKSMEEDSCTFLYANWKKLAESRISELELDRCSH